MDLSQEIAKIAREEAINNNPPPTVATITKIYDENYVDVLFENGESLKFIPCNIKGEVNDTGIVVFLNGDVNSPFVILAGKDGGGGDLSNYYTKSQINTILSSYATIGYSNSKYALIEHYHSQYVTRAEISDLDINLTTLQLVPKTDNPNGVMCFDRVQKTIDELDIDLKADTMSNGYLKIEVNLIEVTRSVNNGNSS